jgi:Ca2+-binding RTX toxin-like protein
MSVPHRATSLFASMALGFLAVLAPAVPAHAASVTCRGVRATVVGTNASEVIHGTLRRDVIAGLDGNDTISAGGGNDLICGGEGADHLYGGAGNDRLYGGLDLFEGATEEDGSARSGDTLAGGPGHDRMFAGADPRIATEEMVPDVISWGASAHGVHIDLRTGTARGEGADTFAGGTIAVVGSPHADVVGGSNRADRIETGTGPDVVRARGGADFVAVDGLRRGPHGDADRVWGGDGDDQIGARHGQDRLFGGAGNDGINSGGGSNDVLIGGDGDDFLYAEIGDTYGPQTFDGGPGTDGIRVASDSINPSRLSSTGIWDMATGAMRLTLDHTISLSVSHFENALFAQPSWRTPGTAWTVTGTPGNDSVAGDANQTVPLHFNGLAGDDSFRGTDGNDVFDGGPGNDHSFAMFLGDDTCTSVETIDLADCEHIS